MSPDPFTLYSLVGLSVIGLAVAILALPVGTCPECEHCRAEQQRRDREADERAHRLYDIPYCDICGRLHDRDREHRR